MLCSIKEVGGFTIAARDGEIGTVRHAYFDDERWVLRYLVVRTGSWLNGKYVLVSPHAVERVDMGQRQLVVQLTRSQVEQAPDVDADKPVSRQQEAGYYDYYGYPYYWAGAGLWGAAAFPLGVAPAAAAAAVPPPSGGQGGFPGGEAQRMRDAARESEDPHLRSSAEVIGYDVEATDGSIGHVEDILFQPNTWVIRHLVIDTRNWLPGHKVLIDPSAIETVSWGERSVRVRLTREAVKGSPAYEGTTSLPGVAGSRIFS